jgi:hypothetical protein
VLLDKFHDDALWQNISCRLCLGKPPRRLNQRSGKLPFCMLSVCIGFLRSPSLQPQTHFRTDMTTLQRPDEAVSLNNLARKHSLRSPWCQLPVGITDSYSILVNHSLSYVGCTNRTKVCGSNTWLYMQFRRAAVASSIRLHLHEMVTRSLFDRLLTAPSSSQHQQNWVFSDRINIPLGDMSILHCQWIVLASVE